jgi:hypothetical protein
VSVSAACFTMMLGSTRKERDSACACHGVRVIRRAKVCTERRIFVSWLWLLRLQTRERGQARALRGRCGRMRQPHRNAHSTDWMVVGGQGRGVRSGGEGRSKGRTVFVFSSLRGPGFRSSPSGSCRARRSTGWEEDGSLEGVERARASGRAAEDTRDRSNPLVSKYKHREGPF